MSIMDLKFNETELAAKRVTTLADRPRLKAEAIKERLDSSDIRERFNQLIDALSALPALAEEMEEE